MDIERYVVTADPDEWGDAPMYDTYLEARGVASCRGLCVVSLTFEFSDSELVDDFRPQEPVDSCERCGLDVGPFCQFLVNEEQSVVLQVDADETIGVRLCADCTEQADAIGCILESAEEENS